MKYGIVLSMILLLHNMAWAQDPHFTQFYANPLYTNPALAGTGFRDGMAASRVAANYRNQWPGLPGNFRTFCLGWDQAFDKLHGGLGVQLQSDVAGSGFLTTSGLMATYAYQGQINSKIRLGIGIQGGQYFRSIDFTKLGFSNPLAPWSFDSSLLNGPPISSTISYTNLNMGFMLSNKDGFLGVAVFNVIEPNISFYQNPNDVLPKRFAIHGGYSIRITDKFNVIPQAQFMDQRYFTQLLVGINAHQSNFIYGLWYRQTYGQYKNPDAIAGTLGYNYKGIRVLYSYDHTISDGRSAIPFSHELSLQFRWKTKQKSTFQSLGIY